MKNNRKNKKLKFIRIKNKLRTGIIPFCIIEKINPNLVNEDVFKSLEEDGKKLLLKRYKLKLNKSYFTSGFVNDDFTKQLITLRVELRLK